MPAVLAIRRERGASVVDFDDGASLRCTRDFARRSGFRRGQEIDAVFIPRLRDAALSDLARSEAQRLSRRQRYSRLEIVNKLAAARIPADAARAALDDLHARGELNDAHAALELARRGLRQELRHDPELTPQRFRAVQTRRLAMRGFDAGTAADACRAAWAEIMDGTA